MRTSSRISFASALLQPQAIATSKESRAEVIKALGFKQYNYVFEQPSAVNLLIKLTPTEVTNAECAVGTLSLVAMFAAPHSLFLTKRKLTTTTIHLMFHHTRRNYERNLQS